MDSAPGHFVPGVRRNDGRGRRDGSGGAAARAGAGRADAVADPGGEGGEAPGRATQPGPEHDDERAGHGAAAAPSGDCPAQPVDDEGEAVGQGEGWCGGHEQNKNIIGVRFQVFSRFG